MSYDPQELTFSEWREIRRGEDKTATIQLVVARAEDDKIALSATIDGTTKKYVIARKVAASMISALARALAQNDN